MILTISTLALITSLTTTAGNNDLSTLSEAQTPSFTKQELVDIINQKQVQHILLDHFIAEIPAIVIQPTERMVKTKRVTANRFSRIASEKIVGADE